MKIIIISPFPPYPPDSGGRIRQWELIKCLSRKHDLTLAFFINKGDEKILDGAFEGICSRVAMITHTGDTTPTGPHALPWPMRAYGVEPMRNLLTELSSNKYDLLITEFIFMAQHRAIFNIPAVLHEHNIESSIFKQYSEIPDVHRTEIFGITKDAHFWKASCMLMRQYENKTWPAFDLRITVSKLDQEEMNSRCPDGKTIVAENGVDTNEFKLLPVNRSKKILFVGTMNYFPNIDGALFMAQSIMPHVWRIDPDIRLCIVGRNMPKHIRDLGNDQRIEIIMDAPDIKVVAAQCCVSVVPLRLGGGTRIKILEAFGLGLPVVSTAKGCEGLAVEDGRHLLIRDNPKEFAAAVAMAVNDNELPETLRKNGRKLVEERYDWQNIFGSAEEKIMKLVK
ncbi:MAG: glycosyltransferase family 4 protein [Deltaproteobacteria bacterium]|nr:glycosyltransferase family 4 protein [Deltaproteobacteria bacterium]